jgi:adenosylcobyric acid synthase
MVQGTASSVGKSLLVTALCSLFHHRGLRVAPFKAQNMALNSAVTPEGREIGRAQAVQAEAAGLEPAVEMNPILLKPEGNLRSQVVMLGKPIATMTFTEYRGLKPELERVVSSSLDKLRRAYDLVIIEGAGSPAEINIDFDVVNMFVARLSGAPVILAADIDRGGVFAQIVGTMELLAAEDRARVAAFLINKFRGDQALLTPGLEFLQTRFGRPVLGVVPYLAGLNIADEDSLGLEDRRAQAPKHGADVTIAVVRLPHISNYDDFLPLEHEPDVALRFAESAAELDGADLVVLPGTKSTVADLDWLKQTGMAAAIARRASEGRRVLGVCGGCQMLGRSIEDPAGVESAVARAPGLGLLPITTRFAPTKVTARVLARVATPSFLTGDLGGETLLDGYEIHMGSVLPGGAFAAPFSIISRNGAAVELADGAIGAAGTIVGTMLHGLFENRPLRAAFLNALCAGRATVRRPGAPASASRADEYRRLAELVGTHLNLDALGRIAGFEGIFA